MIDLSEINAEWLLDQGDPTEAADLLRRGLPLSQALRDAIADALLTPPKKKRGRKRKLPSGWGRTLTLWIEVDHQASGWTYTDLYGAYANSLGVSAELIKDERNRYKDEINKEEIRNALKSGRY